VNNVEDYNEVVKGTEGYVRNMQEYGDGEGVSMRGHVDEITELWWDVGMTCELDLTECTKEVINIPHMENNDRGRTMKGAGGCAHGTRSSQVVSDTNHIGSVERTVQ
jgi:hypothetical protein